MHVLILGPSLGVPTRRFLVPFNYGVPQERATKSNQALIFTGAQLLRGLSCSVALNLPNFEVTYTESSNKKREPSRTLGTFVRSHQPRVGL